jgi:hypothetical protein
MTTAAPQPSDDNEPQNAQTPQISDYLTVLPMTDEAKKWICVWAAYIDSEKSHAEGRRVGMSSLNIL